MVYETLIHTFPCPLSGRCYLTSRINSGISTREATKLEILQFLLDGEERRSEEIVNGVTASKKTIYKYRIELVDDRLVEMLPVTSRDTRPRYRITEKGRNYLLNQSAENLSLTCQIFGQILERLSTPENVEKWRKEGAYTLGGEANNQGCSIAEKIIGLMDHKERVFGGLDRVLADLVRFLVKVKAPIDAKEDLSNVQVWFSAGKPLLLVHKGHGWYHFSPELAKYKELMEQERKERRQKQGS